ncbi:MAG: hypothetical protein AAGA21_13385 [Pseudomonadota bacterium]
MSVELRGSEPLEDDVAASSKPSRFEKIQSALTAIEADGTIADCIVKTPGAFLWEFYKVWVENGGQDGGKNRNSIRRMRDVWLTDDQAVKSLHPKLTGRVRVSKDDARSLMSLFLKRWRFVGVKEGDWVLTADGYAPFPCRDFDSLCDRLIDVMYPDGSKHARNGFLLPVRPGEALVAEAVSTNWQELADLYGDLDAHITLSRHNSSIGPTPSDTIRLFWHLMNNLHDTIGEKDTIFIWIIDIGGRQVEDENSWKDFFNFEMMKTQFRAFASFDSEHDIDDDEDASQAQVPSETSGIHGAFLRSLTIPEEGHREKRWKWLCERTVMLVQNLRREEFENLYEQEDKDVHKFRLRDIGVTAENILPSMMPNRWSVSKELRELYGRELADISDATLTVLYNKEGRPSEDGTRKDVRFFAHTLNPGARDGTPWDLTGRSRELTTPGIHYEEAMRLVYWAARHRLSAIRGEEDETLRQDWAIATAYLINQGFRAIRLADFMRIHRSPGE